MKTATPKSVAAYIASKPAPVQEVLRRVRDVVKAALPEASETIAYQMPAWRLHGGVVLYLAGWNEHWALYPASNAVLAAFADDLARFDVSKGTIRFPLSAPVPVGLIQRIAKFRAREAAARAKKQAAAKTKTAKKKPTAKKKTAKKKTAKTTAKKTTAKKKSAKKKTATRQKR